jgi:hypothetical protein
VVELPTNLVVGYFWPVGRRQAGRSDGISGRAECVRTHMADRYCLTGGSGSGSRRGCLHRADGHTAYEPTADLLGSAQLSSGERPSAGDCSARAFIIWRFSLEQP